MPRTLRQPIWRSISTGGSQKSESHVVELVQKIAKNKTVFPNTRTHRKKRHITEIKIHYCWTAIPADFVGV